eukprot:TRINITY_DN37783_c0_g1_i2.p1 TRINITY_DN37783_c0_g1~~TRINITY_DN37783_c0_g1_i2.p1  ORF type:complete len:181 (-),score=23.53 TRINITY_DN37783_c0_g1_i2:119-661(-)
MLRIPIILIVCIQQFVNSQLICEDQFTLGIIKPNAFEYREQIFDIIESGSQGFKIKKQLTLVLAEDTAKQFYEEHKGKSFFNRLVKFMSSGPVIVMLLERNNAVVEWRKFIGPTDPEKAKEKAANSLRARYGEDKTRNGFHGSDSVDAAMKEIRYFFADFLDTMLENCESQIDGDVENEL